MKKRMQKLAILLAALILALCLPGPIGVAFDDVSGGELPAQLEVLQMMGVVSGSGGGNFNPDGSLTRAEFSKMAVSVLAMGDKIASYKSYTIFPDVKASHWAAGYVNFAVRSEKKFIAGFSDGSFGPDKPILYGEAVTILMRLLGYEDKDVGLVWPTGYLNAGDAAGLSKGLALDGYATLSRAQAAQLFYNLLTCQTKGESPVAFCESLGMTVQKDVILLDARAKMDNGEMAVKTTQGTKALANGHAPLLLQGRRGSLLVDKNDKAWGFVPAADSAAREIVVEKAKAGGLTEKGGQTHNIDAEVKAYYQGKETSYGEIFTSLRSGDRVTLHLGSTGKIESIFVGSVDSASAVVIDRDGNSSRLSLLTAGRTDVKIMRNGEEILPTGVRAYDVAIYDKTSNELRLSNLRLEGRLDYAYPNLEAATQMKLLEKEFTVLPIARAGLAKFKIGDKITVLLTPDLQVAGVVAADKLAGNAVGIASVSGGSATVEMIDGFTLKGKVEGDGSYFNGQLVTVSSWKQGYFSLNVLKSGNMGQKLDLTTGKLGSYTLAANVQIFERVGKSVVRQIALSDIYASEVAAAKIKYSRIEPGGKVSLLILDNVTGGSYDIGISYLVREETVDSGSLSPDWKEGDKVPESALIVKHKLRLKAPKEIGPYDATGLGLRDGMWMGLAVDSGGKIVSTVTLEKLSGIGAKNWESDKLLLVAGKSYRVSEDLICYNRTTGQWVGLNEARAFAENVTAYVDAFMVVRGLEVG